MNVLENIFLAVGLAMDATAVLFAINISKKIPILKLFYIALIFGFWQAVMPLLGYNFANFIERFIKISSEIGGLLILIIAIKMAIDAIKGSDEEVDDSLSLLTILYLSFATSVDAFGAGISLVLVDVSILSAVILIGFITVLQSFIISFYGKKIFLYLKNRTLNRFQSHKIFELLGSVILLFISIKFFFLE